MNVSEYLSVRRAYALVRRAMAPGERITFDELAIMCRLKLSEEPLRTSQIADYQQVLRPTMTHRTNHLAKLGLIGRENSDADRRSVFCALTTAGDRLLLELLTDMCAQIKSGMPLSRCKPERMCAIVCTMGSVGVDAGGLIVLGLDAKEGDEGAAVCELVESLGLLQPTVSMAVGALERNGLTRRGGASGSTSANVCLTEQGRAHAEQLKDSIVALHVRTARRKDSSAV